MRGVESLSKSDLAGVLRYVATVLDGGDHHPPPKLVIPRKTRNPVTDDPTFPCFSCGYVLDISQRVGRKTHTANECSLCNRLQRVIGNNTETERLFSEGRAYFRNYRATLGEVQCLCCAGNVPPADGNFYVNRGDRSAPWGESNIVFLCSPSCAIKYSKGNSRRSTEIDELDARIDILTRELKASGERRESLNKSLYLIEEVILETQLPDWVVNHFGRDISSAVEEGSRWHELMMSNENYRETWKGREAEVKLHNKLDAEVKSLIDRKHGLAQS